MCGLTSKKGARIGWSFQMNILEQMFPHKMACTLTEEKKLVKGDSGNFAKWSFDWGKFYTQKHFSEGEPSEEGISRKNKYSRNYKNLSLKN